MGQYEVYIYLKNQWETGNKKWFTVDEVSQGVKDNGGTNGMLVGIRRDLIRLCVSKDLEFDDLDNHGITNYKKVFRYKENGH